MHRLVRELAVDAQLRVKLIKLVLGRQFAVEEQIEHFFILELARQGPVSYTRGS